MKKILTVCTVSAALLFTGSKASAQAFKKGNNLVNVGIGVGNTYGGLIVGASYEHSVSDDISVGIGADLHHYSYSDYYNYSYSYNFYYFAVRGSYHFGKLLNVEGNKLDPYAGLGLGYESYGNYISSGIFLQAHVGARYYLANNVGAFAEIGAGAATLKLGAAFKF